ncbi:MAG: DNA polymerase I [Alphaproteobacteria bacterium]|nr:DNA polymerase I [Alphaproteobacteria bacterium]MBQ8677700.1 DNA polymerase I [Alphaproteobacteria bacterium]
MSKKICLIDGSGYIFRAFYALPAMTSPDGTPVNAVYGFTNMFLKLTQRLKCDYCLVLFDAKRQNYRNNIFADYKGTRKETPEELIPQFSIIREALNALNIPYLDMEGYEADDLIATYVEQGLDKNYSVTVISADKDLMQLIKPNVDFYDPMKDKFFSPEDVKEKFGVYPDKVIDVQALAGDSIDNIPGVPGIGLKTAAELVNQFGSLENVLTHASEIKQNKRRETLLANTEQARISLQLVTLKKDVPVEHNIEDYPCQSPVKNNVISFVEKYGFNSIRPRIEKWVEEQCHTPQSKPETVKNYFLIENETQLREMCSRIRQSHRFSFETLSDGPNPQFDSIIGLSLSDTIGHAAYVPLAKEESTSATLDLFTASAPQTGGLKKQTVLSYLASLLNDKSILKISFDAKTNIHFLNQIFGAEQSYQPLEDTAVLSYVLDNSAQKHLIPELADFFLNIKTVNLETLTGSGKNKLSTADLPASSLTEYAAERADLTLRLYDLFRERLYKEHQISVYEDLDRPLIPILQKMEHIGIMVDAAKLKNLSTELSQTLQTYEQDVYRLAGKEFNLGSPKQIGDVLFEGTGIKGKKTAGGAWQTGADVLESLAEDGNLLAAKILDWRAFSKLKSTYTDTLLNQLDKASRLHTTFSQIAVNTGRLASSNPNLQNIPIRSTEGKKIRSCFIAPKGCKLISCDYSQVELRLLAVVANVKELKQAFLDGQDIHAATAAKVFNVPLSEVTPDLRRHAKAINFGIVYGISQFGLSRQIDVSPAEAKVYIDSYFEKMPEIKKYMDDTIAFAHKHGYVVTPFGRKCPVFGINDQNKRIVQNAERAAINAPIQGGAADIIKMAMRQVAEKLEQGKFKTKMLLQVHDELIFEAPLEELDSVSKLIKETMQNTVHYDIPFIAELGIGDNWTEAH